MAVGKVGKHGEDDRNADDHDALIKRHRSIYSTARRRNGDAPTRLDKEQVLTAMVQGYDGGVIDASGCRDGAKLQGGWNDLSEVSYDVLRSFFQEAAG